MPDPSFSSMLFGRGEGAVLKSEGCFLELISFRFRKRCWGL